MAKVINARIVNLDNGVSFEAKLTYRKLYNLEKANPVAYKEYSDIILNGTKKEIDYITLLYTAYLCNVENPDMSFDEFIDNCPYGMKTVNLASQMVTNPN